MTIDEIQSTIQLTSGPAYHLIKFPEVLRGELLELFRGEVKAKALAEPPRNVIFNCESIADLPHAWLRELTQLSLAVAKNGRKTLLINVPKTVRNLIQDNGLEVSLRITASLQAAQAECGGGARRVVDVNFINPFLDAVVKVLEVQASVTPKSGKIYAQPENTALLGDISGVIGLVSDQFNGSIVISFPQTTFLQIMSKMLGETFNELTPEIADGAAELTNMVFGNAKVVLNEKGFTIRSAIPSVISGKGHSIRGVSGGNRIVVPFESAVGDFYVEISVSDAPPAT